MNCLANVMRSFITRDCLSRRRKGHSISSGSVSRFLSPVALFLLATLVASLTGCSQPLQRSGDMFVDITSIRAEEREEGFLMTQSELDSILNRFALRFSAKWTQAIDEVMDEADTIQLRTSLQTSRIRYVMAALSISSGADTEANMLDMVVLMSLMRETLEDYWIPQVYGEQIAVLLDTAREMEAEIWGIAAEALTPAHQQELRTLIQEWREQNPDIIYISHIRLSDFASLKRRSALMDDDKKGGLLPEVQDVRNAMDDLTLSANKLASILQVLPLIAGWHAELVYYKLASQPEVEQLLSETGKITDVSLRLVGTLDTLPQWITEERKDLMTVLTSEEQQFRGLVSDLRKTVGATHELVSAIESTAQTTGFRMDDFRAVSNDIALTTKNLNALTESLDTLLVSPGWDKRVPQLIDTANTVMTTGEGLVDHVFYRGVLLIIIFLVGAVLAILSYRLIASRLFRSGSL